jgi:predicted nucleotidyltransferase
MAIVHHNDDLIFLSVNDIDTDTTPFMSEWQTVVKKQRVSPKEKKVEIMLDKSQVVSQLEILKVYNPVAVFLFGSTAKGTNGVNSDLDIVFIWRKCVPKNAPQIKQQIVKMFGKKVDMINMIYNLNNRCDYPEHTQCFIENMMTEGIKIIGSEDVRIIGTSELVGKI